MSLSGGMVDLWRARAVGFSLALEGLASGWIPTVVGRYGRVASGPIRHQAALCSGPGPVNLFQ
jgi:hypothetical protein